MTNSVAVGVHLLVDFWGIQNCPQDLEPAIRQAASACGATVLSVTKHHFGEGFGSTALALLAESHISIHTWPETNYVAIDIFTCGSCNPHDAIPVLENTFKPEKTKLTEVKRNET
jgi:S-adenosylmethionine decarboxylase